MGGAISCEHGLGFDKKSYFQAFASPELLEVMKAIKRALDPDNILNLKASPCEAQGEAL